MYFLYRIYSQCLYGCPLRISPVPGERRAVQIRYSAYPYYVPRFDGFVSLCREITLYIADCAADNRSAKGGIDRIKLAPLALVGTWNVAKNRLRKWEVSDQG